VAFDGLTVLAVDISSGDRAAAITRNRVRPQEYCTRVDQGDVANRDAGLSARRGNV